MNLNEDGWYKSSHSQNQGQCVEVKHHGDGNEVAMRDSVHPGETKLGFPASEWRAFLSPAAE